MGLRIKQNVDLKELEKFGFKHIYGKCYEYIRELDNKIAYRIFTTKKHANIQIEIFEPMIIAKRVQDILYDLIQARISRESRGIKMEKEDIYGWSIVLICILSFILPLMIGINIYHNKTVELEKYKLEMEYKRGDVNNES